MIALISAGLERPDELGVLIAEGMDVERLAVLSAFEVTNDRSLLASDWRDPRACRGAAWEGTETTRPVSGRIEALTHRARELRRSV